MELEKALLAGSFNLPIYFALADSEVLTVSRSLNAAQSAQDKGAFSGALPAARAVPYSSYRQSELEQLYGNERQCLSQVTFWAKNLT